MEPSSKVQTLQGLLKFWGGWDGGGGDWVGSADEGISHFQELTVSMVSTTSFTSGLSRIVTCIYTDCQDHILLII